MKLMTMWILYVHSLRRFLITIIPGPLNIGKDFTSIAPLKTNRFDDHADDDVRRLPHNKIDIGVIIQTCHGKGRA